MPERSTDTIPDDLAKMNKYLAHIKEMAPAKKRELRSQHDVRYTNKRATKTAETEDEQEFCYDHLVNKCSLHGDCGRWHQLRPPRYIGVCKFYITGTCTNGDLCQFMHEDFPCRFYYLDLEHPKSMDKDNCRFKHGGPLSDQLLRFFKKQIKIWVQKMTKEKPEQFDSMMTDYMNKFEAKQEKLELETHNQLLGNHYNYCTEVDSNGPFSIQSILTSKQLKALADRNITTAEQINKIPIDDLMEFGLTLDQIYTITTNTCKESDQSPKIYENKITNNGVVNKHTNDDVVMSDISLNSSINANVNNSSTNIDSLTHSNFNIIELEIDDVLLYGFAQIELKEAEVILQNRRCVLQINQPSSDENSNLSNEINSKFENNPKDEISETLDVNQKPNAIVCSSDDSDNELSLIINEDI